MTQFIISYHGGEKPESTEQGKAHFSKYMDWLSSLGESAISPANPLKGTITIHPDGATTTGSQSETSGYTIIEVDSMTEALKIAEACPFLEIGGRIEVSEIIKMPG